jgi:hypothetical protein
MNPAWKNGAIVAGLAAVAAGASAYFLWTAYHSTGAFGFPLDDPWIHLQFARTLREFGSFSYFRNEMVTSGSTAPLYTLLLAAGFLLTDNEMVLSYVLGILSHVALALGIFSLSRRLFNNDPIPAIGAALLVALEPRLVHASVSGMETGLFAALLVAAYLAYEVRRPVWLGLALGCALWTRPEAILFAAVLAADHLVRGVQHKRTAALHGKRHRAGGKAEPAPGATLPAQLRTAGLIFAAMVAVYVGWNLTLSGSILPNTYAAKVKYYAGGSSGYFAEFTAFVSGGPRVALALLCALGVGGTLLDATRRRSQELLVPVMWTAVLTAAYGLTLPHLYQEGRYLMPVLPFLLLLCVQGVRMIVGWTGVQIPVLARDVWRKPLTAALLVGALLISDVGLSSQAGTYAALTQYIGQRQVRTARWIANNLPADAVVGTHDIGAIGYYSGRRVVDMVGLVSPGMIRHIGDFDGLGRFLASQGVTHLAVLRNWFEVSSQTPLFTTGEEVPEIMEVFAYVPHRTRFILQEVSHAELAAAGMLAAGRGAEAAALMERAAQVEPACARVRFLAGLAEASLGRGDRAASSFREALRLQPDHREAKFALEELQKSRGITRDSLTTREQRS